MSTLTGEPPGRIPLTLPLPQEIPKVFASLPEWYVEDIAEYLLLALK